MPNRNHSEKAELNHLSRVTHRIDQGIEVSDSMLHHYEHRYVPNALLNITINRMIKLEGRDTVSEILSTLSKLISDGVDPNTVGPINLGDAPK